MKTSNVISEQRAREIQDRIDVKFDISDQMIFNESLHVQLEIESEVNSILSEKDQEIFERNRLIRENMFY